MAVTASIAMSASTAAAEQKRTATLTVNNSGGTAVLVTGIQPLATPNGATQQTTSIGIGACPFGGAFPVSVGASGSQTFSFDVVPHAPTTSYGLAEPASLVYSIGATVYTNDGSITAATPATLTVTNPAGL